MCAIYGVFHSNRPIGDQERAWADRAAEALAHRGPDGRGRVERTATGCLLGHARLAIIDLAGGAQPLSNEDGSIWVTANGEIYNYLELREELIDRGHVFRTGSDTEVLVHLYEEMGAGMLDRLIGMFAFAIFDERSRKLLLARDRFGEKPLYWSASSGGRSIAFASEMKALLSRDDFDRSLDTAAMVQFLLLRYVPSPRTHVTGIHKLGAGEAMSVSAEEGLSRWRYWSPDWSGDSGHALKRTQAVGQVRERLREAVRLQLRSDVPVGAFLSGGIDSTAIVTAMHDLQPDRPFATFAVGFDDPALDETPVARRVAEHVGSVHHELRVSADSAVGLLGELIDHCDEPFADPSLLPTFLMCRAARETCKVVLSGDGGDECFAGYRHHFAYYRWNAVRQMGLAQTGARILQPRWSGRRGAGLMAFLASDDRALLNGNVAGPLSMLSRDCLIEGRSGLEELDSRTHHHARLPFPRSVIEKTALMYLPDQILVKVDRASMRVGLETRAPFLDHRLMQFAARLPVGYHFARGQGKALLREALPSWVPDDIRWREKQGFSPPLAAWMRTSIRADLEASLNDIPDSLRPLLRPESARDLFTRHMAGEDQSDLLFRWLVLTRRCGVEAS